ncbi:MAG TPA: nuclear transport factor 2 family protein [Actinomycetota bacterium]
MTDLTDETRRVARNSFEAWTGGDVTTTTSLLDPGFRFTAGDMAIEGRDAFLDAGAFPRDARTTLVDEAYDGGTAFQLYEATRGGRHIVVAERLHVRDGRIVDSRFVTDMAGFMAFVGAIEPGAGAIA